MYYFFFPEEFIELSKEIALPDHQGLHQLLADNTDPVIRIGIIAAYCDVILDDIYTEEDLKKIAHILITRLRAKRTSLVIIDGGVDVKKEEGT